MKKLSPDRGYLLLYGLQIATMHLLGPYLTLWMREMGLGFAQIGVTQSAYMGAVVLLDFPTGGLADKYGRRLCFSLGSAFTSGSLTAWYYDAAGDEGAAYTTFSKANVVEGIVGPLCGVVASAVSIFALNLPIGLSALVGVIAAGIALVCLRENYGGERERSYRRMLKDGLLEVLGNRPLLYLILSGFFMSFVLPTFMLYWVIILRDHGLPEASSGAVYTLLIFSMSLGGLVSQRLAKRADSRKVAVFSTLAWALLFLTISVSRSLPLLALFFVLVEVVYAVRSAALLTFENAVVSQKNRAVVFSFLGTVAGVFGLVANLVIGAAADAWGLGPLYRLAALCALFSALSTLMAWRVQHPRAALRRNRGPLTRSP